MRWGASNGIIGAGGTLNPLGNATRSESMAMIKRMVDVFKLDYAAWSKPFLDVDPLEIIDIDVPPMVAVFTSPPGAELTDGVPLVSYPFVVETPGDHRFVLTGLVDIGRKVEYKVLRESAVPGVFVDMPGFTAFRPLGYREGPELDLSRGNYQVQVRQLLGSSGSFKLTIYSDRAITDISLPPEDINIKNVPDLMQYERQRNEYRFQTPETTRTGLPVPSGTYRFGITSVPSAVGIRSTITLEVFLERGMVSVAGPVDLALFEAVNVVLNDNETYIIRTTQIPITDNVGTVMSDETPYVLRVSAQKYRTVITPTTADTARRTSRISVVNDSFQFIGQMNTYEFTAPENGTYQFRPNLMPGTSRSVFRISDPLGNVQTQTIGVREGISENLTEGVMYRIHVIHQPGNATGDYSFTIVYP
jgi:hypothetical protein